MSFKTKIQKQIDETSDQLTEVAGQLGLVAMVTAATVTVAADNVEQRAVLPNQPMVAHVDESGQNPLRREKEAEVHEQHLNNRVNQRTPARSGRA